MIRASRTAVFSAAPVRKKDLVSDLLDNLSLWTLPAFAVLIAVGFLAYWVEKRREQPPRRPMVGVSAKDAVTSLSMSGIGAFTDVISKSCNCPCWCWLPR